MPNLDAIQNDDPKPITLPPPVPATRCRWYDAACIIAKENRTPNVRTFADDMPTSRADAHNRMGAPGEDLFSGNFNWQLPLITTPGRAGHGFNLALSYNSLVWLKHGTTITFDPDYEFPSPGFRLGFPTLSGPYFNTQVNKQTYQLFTPAGGLVELRQVNPTTYDAEDSSYARLKLDAINQLKILATADGTQYIYSYDLLQLSEIKDRNGNRITISYNDAGLMDMIRDSICNTFKFHYGTFNELRSITQDWQSWGGQEKTLATFDHANLTLQTNFPGLTLDPDINNATIDVINRVNLLDGTCYKFTYNTYGQVTKIERYGLVNDSSAPLLTSVSYNLPVTATAAQTDCPRFTQRSDIAYYWNSGPGMAAVPTVTDFSFDNTATNPDYDSVNEPVQTLTYGQVTTPDGTVHKEFYFPTTWRRGLPKMIETWADGVKKKWTKPQWEQACSGTAYPCNPRVAESIIYDDTNGDGVAENRRRVATTYVAYNLPFEVIEYAADTTTELRRTRTDYNLAAEYTNPASANPPITNPALLNRRILGLPSRVTLFDGSGATVSKVEYSYDESGYLQATPTQPVLHDSVNYGAGTSWRGNRTTIRRYDINDSTNATFVEWKTGYSIVGLPVFTRDPLSHQTTFEYDDKYVDHTGADITSFNFATYAFPTKITDPDGFFSNFKYDYDLEANRFATNPKGATVRRDYDGYGRLVQVTNEVNSAHTQYVYDPYKTYVQSFSTLEDKEDDFYSVTVFDGHNRVYATAQSHPGSSGGYSAQLFSYDTMGRLSQQSNPAEINTDWVLAGDDAAGRGWSSQTYDWQGRPLISTNQDGSTRIASYVGCGCAGGDTATLADEGTLDNGVAIRRQQAVFKDVVGRVVKTQILNWENGTPYSTTINTYNVRDQITSVKEYSGTATGAEACPSATCQITSMAYDGHGRLQSRKTPIESTQTNYSYFADDRAQTITDARGASATFAYNNRGLVTGVTYGVPSGVAATPNVTFGYDGVGNRMWMDDGPGRVDYTYDSLSRIQTEARQFDGLAGSYQLSYTYNLSGQVKTIADNRFNTSLAYNYNKAGQLTGLTGAGFEGSGQTNFISPTLPIKYRAWGGVKEVNYGDNLKSTFGFDNRLQPNSYRLVNAQSQVQDGSDYQYYPDGRAKFASNLVAQSPGITPVNAYDRSYAYDHVGRLSAAASGAEARGETPPPPPINSPYKQTNTYDTWGNLTERNNRFWRINPNDNGTYSNNRRQGWQYDPAGNILADTNYHTYDAASRQIGENSGLFYIVGGGDTGNPQMPSIEIAQSYDGDGLPVKRVETKRTEALVGQGPQTTITTTVTTVYQIRPRMSGGNEVMEVDAQGNWAKGFVYAGGTRIAENVANYPGGPHYVLWRHANPVTGTLLKAGSNGTLNDRMEFDPFGAEVGSADPYFSDPTPTYLEMRGNEPLYIDGGDPFDLSGGCEINGLPQPCSEVARLAASGSLQAEIYNGGVFQGIRSVEGGVGGGYFLKRDAWSSSYSWNSAGQSVTTATDESTYAWISGEGDNSFGRLPQKQKPGIKERMRLYADETADADLSKEQKLREAVLLASNLLANPLCNEYLSANNMTQWVGIVPLKGGFSLDIGGSDASYRLSYLYKNDKIRQSSLIGEAGGLGLPGGPILLGQGFYNSDVGGDALAYQISSREARALLILHELGHSTGRYFHGPTAGFGETIGDEQLQQGILKNCFNAPLPLPRNVG